MYIPHKQHGTSDVFSRNKTLPIGETKQEPVADKPKCATVDRVMENIEIQIITCYKD